MNPFPSHQIIFALIGLSVAASGCLKTRAQLKEDEQDPTATPVSNPIQDVPATTGAAAGAGGGSYVVDELKAEIARLTGRIDELERGSKGDSTSVKSLETRVAELEKAQAEMIEAYKKVQTKAPAPLELLTTARERYAAKNYDGAIEALDSFLSNPKGRNNEEAVYLRGESFFAKGQYKKAIADFSRFPESFSRSRRMPQALYKIGMSFDALGMRADAQPFYQELLEKFPESSEAKKARTRKK